MKSKRVTALANEYQTGVKEIIDIVRTLSPKKWAIGPNTKIEPNTISLISKYFAGEFDIEIPTQIKSQQITGTENRNLFVTNTDEIPLEFNLENKYRDQVIELVNQSDNFKDRGRQTIAFEGETLETVFTDFEAFSICGGIDDGKARYISRQFLKKETSDHDVFLAHQFAMLALDKYGASFLSFCLSLPPLPFPSQLAHNLFAEIDTKRNLQKFPTIRILHTNKDGQTEKLTLSYYSKLDTNHNRIRFNNVIQIRNKATEKRIMTITRDGNIIPEKNAADIVPIIQLFIRFSQNPKEYIINYGFETGECSICGRELTNPESVKKGIGPICNSYVN